MKNTVHLLRYAGGDESHSEADRFEDKYEVMMDDSCCWIWTGCRNKDGYGSFRAKIRPIGAHRYSYTLYVGPIPRGKCVLHNCPGGDNPSCVNPKHLWVGTKKENNIDCANKGRHHQIVKSYCPRNHAYSTDNTAMQKNKRSCKICKIELQRIRRAKSRSLV